MGTISPAQASDGITSVSAAAINGPINTITDEFNGNIDNSNIKTGAAIATAKLASDAGILAAMMGLAASTQANAGTAGGNIYYISLGTLKIAWGITASKTNNAGLSANYTVTLPTSFFSTIQTSLCNIAAATGSVNNNGVLGVSCTTTTLTMGWFNDTGSPTIGGTAAWMVIGT